MIWRHHAFWVSCLASSVVFTDVKLGVLALDAIQAEYGVAVATIQLLPALVLLPTAAGVLLAGDGVDRFGRRKVLTLGLLLYALLSLHWLFQLPFAAHVVFRLLQGAALTMIIPSSQAILAVHFDGAMRSQATSRWVVVTTLITVLLAPLFGALVEGGYWRFASVGIIPIAMAAARLSRGLAPQPRPAARPFDLISVAFLVVGASSIVLWGLGSRSLGFGIELTRVLFLLGVLGLLFLFLRSRVTPNPLLPVDLWRSPTIRSVNATTVLTFGTLAALHVALPLVLIQGYGWSATQVGLMTLLYEGPIIALAVLARSLYAFDARYPLAVGSGIVVIGLGILAWQAFEWSALGLLGWVLVGIGMAGPATCLTATVLDAAPPDRVGATSALNSTSARLGSLLSVALLGGWFADLTDTYGIIVAFQRLCFASGALVLCAVLVVLRGVKPKPGETFRGNA